MVLLLHSNSMKNLATSTGFKYDLTIIRKWLTFWATLLSLLSHRVIIAGITKRTHGYVYIFRSSKFMMQPGDFSYFKIIHNITMVYYLTERW